MSQALLSSRGFFWWMQEPIPEGMFAPPSALPGTLVVDEVGNTTLKLDAILARPSGPLGALFGREAENKPIQGMLAGANLYVLLFDLIPNGASVSAVGPSGEAFIAHRCLSSTVPFSTTTGLAFNSVELPLTGFEEWLGLKSISVSKSKSSITARYSRPRQPKWKLTVGNMQLKFGITYPFPDKYASVSFHESPSLVLDLKTAVDLDEALSLFMRIQDLLILLTDCDRSCEFPILRATPNGAPIRLYFARLAGRSAQLRWHHCWMRFPQLKQYFGSAVENWLAKHASVGAGFSLYMASRRDQLYAEHRFATLVWGLESLHRHAYPTQGNTALCEKIARIVEQIERAADRKWVQRQLKGAGEPTLATRLHDIFKKLPLQFKPAQMQAFTEEVARRRNDLSHFGGMRHVNGYDTFIEQVLRYTRALDLLYHATLLLEIGIPETAITWWFMEGFCSHPIQQTLTAAEIPLLRLPESSGNHTDGQILLARSLDEGNA